MIEKTENIGLVKEDENEFYNIGTVNGNLDRIDEEFGKKVNKAEGKDLSSNDYTTAEKEKLKNIDENANYYTHPTTAGNKHIPSGGSSGQVLKYGGSSGTASWGSDSYYGTCSTAASTAAKTVALEGFTLFTGATVAVMFSNGNTAASPTLNVNSTGAKTIYYRGSALTSSTASIIAQNGVYLFVYSGSYWRLVGDVGSIAMSEVADRLTTPRTIDGISFDGSADIVHFGVCETSAAALTKNVDIPGFVLKEGARVLVEFINGNSYQNGGISLNVNSTGGKLIASGFSYPDNFTYFYGIFQKGIYEFIYYAGVWMMKKNYISDEPVYFSSNDTDDSNAKSWTSISALVTNSTLRSLFNKISTMFKNLRYLYRLLGSTDISAIGDGTVTKAIELLKNGMENLYIIKTYAVPVSIAANNTVSATKAVDVLEGFKPVMVQLATTNNSLCTCFGITLSGYNLTVGLRNNSAAAVSITPNVYVLYIRTGL